MRTAAGGIDRVSIGGFVPVTLLILALLLSRAAVRRLLLKAADGSPLRDDDAPDGSG